LLRRRTRAERKSDRVRLRASIHRVRIFTVQISSQCHHHDLEQSGRADRNTRSTSQATDAREKEIPIVVDVDEIHTPEYEENP
jgi:hypothetical protein